MRKVHVNDNAVWQDTTVYIKEILKKKEKQ